MCAVSPAVPGLIAGCEHVFFPGRWNGYYGFSPDWVGADDALMVYFSTADLTASVHILAAAARAHLSLYETRGDSVCPYAGSMLAGSDVPAPDSAWSHTGLEPLRSDARSRPGLSG